MKKRKKQKERLMFQMLYRLDTEKEEIIRVQVK